MLRPLTAARRFRSTASGTSNSKVRRRGSTARAIRFARPEFGRHSSLHCAARKAPDATGAASKSQPIGRESVQEWHPEEECRPPNPQFPEQRFANAKAMGLNTLRCHVKISRSPLFRSRRPARSHRLARHVLHAVPGADDARGVAPGVPDVGLNAWISSFDLHLDAVQRGMGN